MKKYTLFITILFIAASAYPVLTSFTLAADPKVTEDRARYSDRDRMRSSKDDEDKLEKALKTGEEKEFYRRELEKLGWQITSINYDKPDPACDLDYVANEGRMADLEHAVVNCIAFGSKNSALVVRRWDGK